MANYIIFIGVIGGIYGLLALSLNLIWGSAGMVNLGLAGVFAVGAYTSALLTTSGGLPIPVGLLAAMLAGIAVGLLLTFSTIRLRDDYLAIVTLGFAEIVRIVALNETWLTKGADGVSGIRAPFKAELGPWFNASYLAFVTLIVLIVWALLTHLDRTPYGRALKAIREDGELAAFAGKPVIRFKLEAFALSAAIAALAGALYGHFTSYISPDHFQPQITIYIFLAVTAGGLGRPTGVVVGAYLVIALIESTRALHGILPFLTAVQAAAIREMAVGLALVLLLHWRPQGLLPERLPKAPVLSAPPLQDQRS
jgi:branched-chain amino acid transport system permease protein